MHTKIWDSLQGTNVYFLALSNLLIGRARLYECSEISNTVNGEARQNSKAQIREVHPFVRGIFGGSIIEIEAIDVDVCSNCRNEKRPLKKQSRLTAARALAPKIEGV